ncbi:MAG: hypothetical protein ACRDQ7_10625 [Haloechinothrix sp.]
MAVAAVLLIAVLAMVFFPFGSPTTYSAGECRQPGAADEAGFTGCLRQRAGVVADGQCSPGMATGPAGGRYAAAAGNTMSVPTFAVPDRSLLGYIVQDSVSDNVTLKTPSELAGYFEQRIRPGE